MGSSDSDAGSTAAGGTPAGPPGRLDLTALAPSIQHYFDQGLAQSTLKTYNAAMKRFHAFCVKFKLLSPFPVSEYLLCGFAAFLADQGLAPQTAKCYLAAVRNMQLSLGLPDPRDHSSLPMLKRVLAGISRARMSQQVAPRVRLPITAPLLARMQVALQQSAHPDRVLIWAVACLAFFGIFRHFSAGRTPSGVAG